MSAAISYVALAAGLVAVSPAPAAVAGASGLPATPQNVRLYFGDGTLGVRWSQPRCDGGCSAIVGYRLRVNGEVRRLGPSTHATLTGLTNGTRYAVQVLALNSSYARGAGGIRGAAPHWSRTAVEAPNAEPTVTQVSAIGDPPDAAPSALLSWTADDGGYPVTRFQLRTASGTPATCTAVSGSSCRVAMTPGTTTSYRIRLFNRSAARRHIDGWGPWSSASNGVRGASLPGPVQNLTLTPTGNSGQATITFDQAALHGADFASYWASIGNGAPTSIASGATIGGLPDGQATVVKVWATSLANGRQSAPGPAATTTVNAFGPCSVALFPLGAGSGTYTFGWTVQSHGRMCTWSGSDAGQPNGSGQGMSSTHVVTGPSHTVVSLTVTVATQTAGSDPAVMSSSASASGMTE